MNATIKKMIVELILSNIDKDLPWQQPWRGMAQNYITGKPYRGVNQIMLSVIASKNNWRNQWITRKQAWSIGNDIQKGERYSPLIKYIFVPDEDEGCMKYIGAKYYQLYSIDQLRDVPEQTVSNQILKKPEEILANSPVQVPLISGGNSAYYLPLKDVIHLPNMQDFISSEHYYSTWFHELSHATGHASRLGRFTNEIFINRETYAEEELIAEFSAAFLCGECGISNTHDQSTAYIAGWKKAIKKDPDAMVKAISFAQRATDLILGVKFDPTEDEDKVEEKLPVTVVT